MVSRIANSAVDSTIKPRMSLNMHRYHRNFVNVQRNEKKSVQIPIYHINETKDPIKRKIVHQQEPPSRWKQTLRLIDEYCDNSTLHGLKYVGDNKLSIFERCFWLIAFLVAVAFACYFISILFIDSQRSPIIISFNPVLAKVSDIPFPGITICNLNVAMKSRAEKLNREGSLPERSVLDKLCDYNTSGRTENFDSNTFTTVVLNTTQRCREMMVYCEWEGKSRNCRELINPVITDDGYCCTFNKLPMNYSRRNAEEEFETWYPKEIINWNSEIGFPWNVSNTSFPYRGFGRGENLGLTLVLDANLDEYYCSTTNSVGFKAVLATPIDSPKISDMGFLIAPGFETRFQINADIRDASENIRSLDWSKRQCFYSRERSLSYYKIYTQRNCMLECQSNLTMDRCGCIPFYLPRLQGDKICDNEDEACSDAMSIELEKLASESSSCNCLSGCNEILYSVSSSDALLSTEHQFVAKEMLKNVTNKYFARNMAIVHFFYPTTKFQKTTTDVVYHFSGFLSNTGGLLGLFMGFSFLSAVEIIYHITIKGFCKCSPQRRQIRTNNVIYNRPYY